MSGWIAKWAIELEEFDIEYIPQTPIKTQALAEFIAKFTGLPGVALESSKKTVDVPGEDD